MSAQERPPDEDEFLDDDERRIFEIGEEYLIQLQAGQAPDRDAILAAHPTLGEELRFRLLLMENIWRAGQ